MKEPDVQPIQLKHIRKKDKKVLLKLDQLEYNKIKKKADKYTNGNKSEWLRWAALNMIPSKRHLEMSEGIETVKATDFEVLESLEQGQAQHKDAMERLSEND